MNVIYLYTNSINNKVYIGQTNNLNKRISCHKHDALKRNYNYPLYNAIRKYGLNNFNISILEENVNDLDNREIYWINFYNSTDRQFGYNIELGGTLNKTMSPETRNKISVFRKIFMKNPKNNPMYQKHHSDQTKLKISLANKGKCYNSIEHLQKISKISAAKRIGTKMKDDIKLKISKSHLGFKHSNESKLKMSIARKGELNSSAKLTWDIVNNIRQEYASGKETVKSLIIKYNISESQIYRIIKNKTWKNI